MNVVLSVQGFVVFEKIKLFFMFCVFNKKKVLKVVKVVLLVVVVVVFFLDVVMVIIMVIDLMKFGDVIVKGMFGKQFSVVKWVVLVEVVVGGIMYMMIKNVKFLFGFVIIFIFIIIGMLVVGY